MTVILRSIPAGTVTVLYIWWYALNTHFPTWLKNFNHDPLKCSFLRSSMIHTVGPTWYSIHLYLHHITGYHRSELPLCIVCIRPQNEFKWLGFVPEPMGCPNVQWNDGSDGSGFWDCAICVHTSAALEREVCAISEQTSLAPLRSILNELWKNSYAYPYENLIYRKMDKIERDHTYVTCIWESQIDKWWQCCHSLFISEKSNNQSDVSLTE